MKRKHIRAGVLLAIACSTSLSAVASDRDTDPSDDHVVYFVVGPFEGSSHTDSYVLPLTDPVDIAHARRLIEIGATAQTPRALVSASIAPGSDGINRNAFLRNGGASDEKSPLWCWHIDEFGGFSDDTIELCDGTPTQVDADPCGFIANAGGICFWAYTVVAELGPQVPVPPAWRPKDCPTECDDPLTSVVGRIVRNYARLVPPGVGGDLTGDGYVDFDDLTLALAGSEP